MPPAELSPLSADVPNPLKRIEVQLDEQIDEKDVDELRERSPFKTVDGGSG